MAVLGSRPIWQSPSVIIGMGQMWGGNGGRQRRAAIRCHPRPRVDTTFEVDDGTGMARVKLRDLDSGEIAFQGIDPHLFAPVGSTSGS